MYRIKQLPSPAKLFALSLALASPVAGADETKTGLVLQPMLALGTVATYGASGTGAQSANSGVTTLGFTVIPTLRIGAELPSLIVAANVGFTLDSLQTNNGGADRANSVLALGVDLEPFLWRSADRAVRIYVLAGGGVLATTQPGGTNTAFGGSLSVGVGGLYRVHPNFAVGMELGSHTQVIALSYALAFTNTVYFGFTGTFSTATAARAPQAANP